MPKKKCGLGFSCAAMMLSPGLDPGNCPNYKTCGSATQLIPDEVVELHRARMERQQQAQTEWEMRRERIHLSRRQAAVMMLRMRGCPQNPQGLGVDDTIDQLDDRLRQLEAQLQAFADPDVYIAPEGCEVHRYAVARPYGKYWYNRITAAQAIFEPAEREQQVKTIHLSHDDDPRNIEARLGIERRNRLVQIKTQLERAESALSQAIELASRAVEIEEFE